MIDTKYAVNCLKQGFKRYIQYRKINATIECGVNYVSFYVKDGVSGKQYLARGSNHHFRMQHLADKDEPWNGDNVSIVFITPNSPQDLRIRPRVRQNHYGGIKPFDVTTYQYDNTILDERDLHQIFHSIISFLNGLGYTDPFAKTPKAAKVVPISANIKPYKEPTKKAKNISVDKDGNYVSANAWGADYVSENKQYNTNRNMNKKLIRLNESDLHKIVKESVNRILKESLDSHMMIDDKNRVFDAFKNLVHVMIWENGNIGGDENTLIDAENGYLQEYGERDLQIIWNNVENYTWNKVDKQNSIGNSMQQPSQL